jgi:hypothetical protein
MQRPSQKKEERQEKTTAFRALVASAIVAVLILSFITAIPWASNNAAYAQTSHPHIVTGSCILSDDNVPNLEFHINNLNPDAFYYFQLLRGDKPSIAAGSDFPVGESSYTWLSSESPVTVGQQFTLEVYEDVDEDYFSTIVIEPEELVATKTVTCTSSSILTGSFTVLQTAVLNPTKAVVVPGFAEGSHQITIEINANYEYNTGSKTLTVDRDSLKGKLWIDKGTSRAKSFPLSDVTALSVSPDFKTITYKANIRFGGGTLIVGTITGTLTFDPAIDFEQAKDQSAKTSKMTLELSIAKVKLDFNRVLTGAIDFN